MSGQLTLEGNIVVGPPNASDSSFPGGVDAIPLKTTPSPKTYVNREHKERQYTGAVGVALDFTGISATFVYIRTNAAVSIIVTTQNGGAESAAPFSGIYMREFDPSNPCTGITITGTALVEYLIAG